MMSFNKTYLAGCLAVALGICAVQIVGAPIVVLMGLAMFMGFMALSAVQNFSLPILLFFLSWAPILKIRPGTFSFYTIALVMICMISSIKNRYGFRKYHIASSVLLIILTLIAKLIDGSTIALDYIFFMLLMVMVPVMQKEALAGKYSAFDVVIYLTVGAVFAGFCAQWFAGFENIARYVRVDAYLTIVRRCGFSSDPNFYMAQITAAIGGCLILMLNKSTRGRTIFLGVMLMLLLYCGFMSGSKTFALVAILMVLMWMVELFRLRNQPGLKALLIVCVIIGIIYIATSSIFGDLIDMMITRFSFTRDLSSLTTKRTDIWINYLDAIIDDLKVLLIGNGLTDAAVFGRASHNTALQMIFQFGIIGSAVLLVWIFAFYWHENRGYRFPRRSWIRLLIVITGIYLPWMSIDTLFFDEFFILQWYCLIAVRMLGDKTDMQKLAEDEFAARAEANPESVKGY